MPYNIKDFDEIVHQKMSISIHPHGWVSKDGSGVEVEYGWCVINQYDPEESLCMRVKGTNHYWAWFRKNFIQLSRGDYAELFKKQLEEFRIEFLLWIKNPDTARLEWVREYYEIFQGMFYDFSPEEQEEYEMSQRALQRDKDTLDRLADKVENEGIEVLRNTTNPNWNF